MKTSMQRFLIELIKIFRWKHKFGLMWQKYLALIWFWASYSVHQVVENVSVHGSWLRHWNLTMTGQITIDLRVTRLGRAGQEARQEAGQEAGKVVITRRMFYHLTALSPSFVIPRHIAPSCEHIPDPPPSSWGIQLLILCQDLDLDKRRDSLVPEHPRLLVVGAAGLAGPPAPQDVCPRHVRGVGGGPVLLQPGAQVLRSLLQVVLVQDDVPHLQWTLRQLLSGHHLHVHVLGLGLSPGLDQSL